MGDFNRKAAKIQLYGLVAALALAGLIAAGITVGAFVLSFAAQRDLARQADIAPNLTWIFPAIVDGAILGSTIAVVVLSKLSGKNGRGFFAFLAVVVVFISVYGNAFHAWHRAQEIRSHAASLGIATDSLTPTAAALIAVIPPLLTLAFTHGCGVLIKAIGNAYTEYRATAVAESAVMGEAEAMTHPALRNAGTGSVEDEAEPMIAPVVAEPVAERATPQPATLPEPEVVAEAVAQQPAVSLRTVAAVAEPEPTPEVVAEAVAQQPAVSLRTVAESVAAVAEPEPTPEVVAEAVAQQPAVSLRTVAELLDFIESTDLDSVVKLTARLKINNPDLSFSALAAATDTPHASTAQRRYKKAEEAALAAGFTVPPLPDLEEDHHSGRAKPALVMSR